MSINDLVLKVNDVLTGSVLIIALVGIGLLFTFKLGFIQIRGFKDGWNRTFGGLFSKKGDAGKDGMSSFQALATAIAAQVGTGNIAGAATAIAVGGPGAIFWMWISAFLGMSTIFAEAVMAQKFKQVSDDGTVTGGPVYYIRGAFKGTFGKVLLIAGNEMTSGAALLSASSALHTGVGMVKVHTRKENRAILPVQLPEAMYCFYGKKEIKSEALAESLEWADVVGIGPGLGTNKQAEALLEFVLKYSKRPLVIDADGLNLLKSKLDLLEKYEYPVIMTPHLGEFSRLSGLSIKDWKQQPIELTNELAHRYNVTLVCKDARTVIADGGQNVYVNTTGNSGMATAGSGDVLTGILLGLLAQGYAPLDAAVMGVCVHGLAGDEAAKEKGKYAMVAGDLITYTGDVLKKRG